MLDTFIYIYGVFLLFYFDFSSTHTGNGYIEGGELDGFLREFVASANVTDVSPEVGFLFAS